MALTNWNDILNKPKGIDEVPEIALTVEQLSASVLSLSEDVGEIAEDVQEIVNDFIVLDDTDFTWNNDVKRFSKNISLSGYKAIIVNATNGTAVMGGFYSSQNNILYVCGFIPVDGTSIDDAYHFKVLIIK